MYRHNCKNWEPFPRWGSSRVHWRSLNIGNKSMIAEEEGREEKEGEICGEREEGEGNKGN